MQAYWLEMDRRRKAHEAQMRAVQQAIDDEADPQRRLEMNRLRYKCGAKFVTADSLRKYPAHLEELMTLENHTTCDLDNEPRSYWSSANDNIEIEESDVMRREQIQPELNEKIILYKGDITSLEVDAIVNAANESLMGGGGIDGAIHSAAGPMLVEECRPLRGCATGGTKITRGYALPAKFVLHTVGPMGRGDQQLRSCYRTCLELVESQGLRTVAFCCVGTGIFGFPLVRATHIALSEVRAWLARLADAPSTGYNLNSIDSVIFCCFKSSELMAYERIAPSYFPVAGFPAEELVDPEADDFNRDDGVRYGRAGMGGRPEGTEESSYDYYGDSTDGQTPQTDSQNYASSDPQ